MIEELKSLLNSNGISDLSFDKIIYDNLIIGLFVLIVNDAKDEKIKLELKKRINRSINKSLTIKNVLNEKFGCKVTDNEAKRLFEYLEAFYLKNSIRKNYDYETRTTLLDKQKYKCNICGTDILIINSELDHVIPWDYVGDELGIGNLQMLCKSCNRRKGKNINFHVKMFLVNKKSI